MRVLVTGGTGRLGSAVVQGLRDGGHEPTILSRTAGDGRVVGELATGVGLPAAVEGVDAIVHAASDSRGDARATDVEGTRRLARAGIPILYVSIVGVERHPLKYYQIKHEGELTLAGTGCPWTVLRATQFHAFVDDILGMSYRGVGGKVPFLRGSHRQPLLVPSGWRLQPVSHYEVADRIVDLVEAGPTSSIEQFAGPEELDTVELARAWADKHIGKVVAIPTVGRVASAYRRGYALPAAGVELGEVTWADYLHGATR